MTNRTFSLLPRGASVLAAAFLATGCAWNDTDGASSPASSTPSASQPTRSAPSPTARAIETPRNRPFRTYDAATFYETTSYSSVGGRAFSPDSRYMLITSDASGVFNVHRIDRATGEITQLTDSTDHATLAQSYFPDSQRILYTYDEGGNELNHIVVREEDGTIRDLTPGENLKANFSGWHEDGSAFFIQTNERDPQAFDLYRYATDGYGRTLVYENTNGWGIGAVSPNGRRLILVEAVSSADTNMYLVDLENGGEPKPLTEREGDISYSPLAFTPDSLGLVYSTDEHGEFAQAWLYDLSTFETSPLVVADWDVSGFSYSSTGRYRVSYINEDAVTVMQLVDTSTGETVSLPELPQGEILSVRFNPDDSLMSFLINGDTRPSDLFTIDLSQPEDQRVAKAYTSALNPGIAREHLVEAEVVRYPSFDGVQIPSILYKPKTASSSNPVPALVLVHGGPGGQTTKGYRAQVQHLVNHGYAILGANNRGSSGYGKTFFHMDDKRHGEDDLRDIVEGRAYLESLDWVDSSRIGIMGGSYGGYMTAAALAFHPTTFDVGVNIFGVTNWVRTLESIPPWWGAFRDSLYDEMGDPATDAERHRRISPLFHASHIEKPLLVVQGANDPRVLQVESDELVEAVMQNGVPVEYLVFPDEGHGFRKRANRIQSSESILEFLDKHLKNAPRPSEASASSGN